MALENKLHITDSKTRIFLLPKTLNPLKTLEVNRSI